MAYLNAAIEELKELVAATWPDVVGTDGSKRVYEAEHIALVPLETLTLPAAILVVESQPWQDGPITRSYVQLDCLIYRVTQNAGKPSALRPDLEALRDALYPATTLTESQVWPEPLPHAEWSLRLDINRLLRGKKLQALAGRVAVRLIAGPA